MGRACFCGVVVRYVCLPDCGWDGHVRVFLPGSGESGLDLLCLLWIVVIGNLIMPFVSSLLVSHVLDET